LKLFPCVRGRLGTWSYFSTKMSAESLAESVQFAAKIEEAKVLDRLVQRELNESRAKDDIARYLSFQDGRFFNSIVVAAWEGSPTFFQVDLAADPRFEMIADRKFEQSFGVLRFDGSQRYYALDGQHRLRAIRALLSQETEYPVPSGFAKDEFPVIIVVPNEGETFENFVPRYRRLFSNLNRYAKPMDQMTIVSMDEDDAIAIATRRLIVEHEFFWWEKDEASRIKVQKGKSISETENCLLTLVGLYEMNQDFLWSAKRQEQTRAKLRDWIKERPSDADLDAMNSELREIWNAVLGELPELSTEVTTDFRSRKGDDFEREGRTVVNHLLFRPIGQRLLSRIVRYLIDDSSPGTPVAAAIKGLASIEWRLYKAPWRHLLTQYDSTSDSWTMRTDKESQAVALDILRFITGIDQLDAPGIDTLRSKWQSLLVNPDQGYPERAWPDVVAMAERFPSRSVG
jgi:DNA sulfur modification protein DndB